MNTHLYVYVYHIHICIYLYVSITFVLKIMCISTFLRPAHDSSFHARDSKGSVVSILWACLMSCRYLADNSAKILRSLSGSGPCIGMNVRVHIYICMCVCVWECIDVCAHIYTWWPPSRSPWMCLNPMYRYIYIYMNIYIHIYT